MTQAVQLFNQSGELLVTTEREAEVHVMYNGTGTDIETSRLDIGDLSSDSQIREAVALYMEVPPNKLANYAVDRNLETGDITLRPQAVFG